MPTVSFNTRFPGYEILGELSRSNARVLKARHLATGDLVAIKHFALNTDADTLRRFERESAIMTAIAHPNIIKVREIRLDAELPFIVMNLIEGGSVRQLLTEQGQLTVATTIRFGLQLVDAFGAIHPQGIIHRDIKPENILFQRLPSEELHFLLTDFGIARLHEQNVTVTGQSLMTYEYAAPEQFDNPRNVDAATDYYALGVVLYECLSGRVPFAMNDGAGIVTFMNTVLTTTPPALVLNPDKPLPPSLTDLLKGLLAKRPTERISSPDRVKLALKQAELDQLRLEQGAKSNATATGLTGKSVPADLGLQPALTRPLQAGPDVANAVTGKQPESAPTTAPASSVDPAQTPVRRSAGSLPSRTRRRNGLFLLAGLVLLSAVLSIYYFRQEPDRRQSASPGAGRQGVVLRTNQHAQTIQQRTDSLQLQEQRRQQALVAVRQVQADLLRGRVGLFGGVKGMRLRLRNPTPLTFRYVLVKVRYVKDNGSLYKSENVSVPNVGPYATETRLVPDSPRGTRFSARIIGYESPDIPADPPESLSTAPIQP